jgi:hypothetical protein
MAVGGAIVEPAMARTPLVLAKTIAFVALFLLLNRILDATEIRFRLLNAFVDSISQATGISGKYIDVSILSAMAYGLLRIITLGCSFLSESIKG